ncbi:competence protein ComEC [Massilia sp. Root418]|uniref:DNA internalization-related competence protein ComEC/Rec2 n=1 Tax=Massilia sp. Root418 TaxID=1736532 RepID=UPI0006F5C45F|nr:DNA internalization-related competence protein ComEC/Rec2 [Massilia sp. Root418]KQX01827.1 competence protein ComEC [Massilia sp. Root418]
MRCAILGFVGGAAWLQMQAALPAHAPAALAASVAAGVGAAVVLAQVQRWLNRRTGWLRHGLALCAGAAIGFYWAALLAQSALAPKLAKADEGRDVTLIGTIDNLPNRFDGGVRFNFAVEEVERRAMRVPALVALSWYAGYRGEAAPIGDVQPGERWRLTVRLQRPHGNANPYGFDYELWLLEQGVRATGYVRQDGRNQRLASFVVSFGNMVERCRAVLRDRILRALEGKEYAGVIVALVVGDQRGIPQSDWQVFNRTGISHLISISGLHITMIAGLFALAASALWRRSFFTHAQLPLLLPAQKVAALAGLTAALCYVLLAGFGVPAQRTLYMLAVVAVALWTDRLTGVTHVLCLAAGVVVLLDPWAVMWPGFWLSFGAVATILYATVGRAEVRHRSGELAALGAGAAIAGAAAVSAEGWPGVAKPAESEAAVAGPVAGATSPALRHPPRQPLTRHQRWMADLKTAARVQYAVTVGLVPLTMLLFAQVSIVSPLANAVAIPVVSLLVTPLALAGAVLPDFLALPLLQLAHAIIWLLAQALEWLSASRIAVWTAPTPPPWVFCWALFGTTWMLAPRGWPVRWLGLVTWAPLLAAVPSHPSAGAFRVVAFDVGQGMALLVETSGHRLLYDTGPAYSPESNGGNRVIAPYLKARGITALDAMVVSHADADHIGGALAVMDSVRTAWTLSSLPSTHPVVRASALHTPCAAGQHWTWDGVRFDVLHPAAGSYRNPVLKNNARSCVLRISAGGRAMLLAGDIEAAQETELLARAPGALASDVLLAPHHGSGTSSTQAFLAAVQPGYAVFQVGYRNRYHHPQKQVYQRYGGIGAVRLRTDESGALTLEFNGQLAVERYRESHPRYWRQP